MRRSLLALAALFVAALLSPASACDRRPVRTFIANHRPGIIIPKPVYTAPSYPTPGAYTAPQTYPSGGVIVVGYSSPSCATGNCPLPR